jgi:plastocyanin
MTHRALDLVAATLLPVCLSLSGASPVQTAGSDPEHPGYEEIEVVDGGSVTGTVRTDEVPKKREKPLPVTKDHRACGEHVPDESLIRAPSGALKNAVVYIDGIARGKAIDRTLRPRLDNSLCRFKPHVLGVVVGQKIEITNSDPVLHNTHAKMDGKKTVFNVALPVQNQKVPKTIRRAGMMTIQCDAGHIWMSGHILAFHHPYFAVTDEAGRFRIDGIPPGAYRLKAWHEVLGEQSLDLAIEPSAESEVTIDALGK